MCARPYKLGKRQETTDQNRIRIIEAARQLILSESFTDLTIEAVAKQADVARMTVYYQFESKLGLLEALFDDIALRGQMDKMVNVFTREDPLDALSEYISLLGHFWTPDRVLLRRLRSLGKLVSEFQSVITRDAGRMQGLNVLLEKISQKYGKPENNSYAETLNIIYTLTSFETFDTMAGETKTPEEVTGLIKKIIFTTLGLEK